MPPAVSVHPPGFGSAAAFDALQQEAQRAFERGDGLAALKRRARPGDRVVTALSRWRTTGAARSCRRRPEGTRRAARSNTRSTTTRAPYRISSPLLATLADVAQETGTPLADLRPLMHARSSTSRARTASSWTSPPDEVRTRSRAAAVAGRAAAVAPVRAAAAGRQPGHRRLQAFTPSSACSMSAITSAGDSMPTDDSDEAVRDPGLLALLRRHRRVRSRGRPRRQRLHPAQGSPCARPAGAGGGTRPPPPRHAFISKLSTPPNPANSLLRALVLRMAGQPRVVDASPPSDASRARPRSRARCGSAPPPAAPASSRRAAAGSRRADRRCPLRWLSLWRTCSTEAAASRSPHPATRSECPFEVLGGAVEDEVEAQLDRPQVHRRRERAVDDAGEAVVAGEARRRLPRSATSSRGLVRA